MVELILTAVVVACTVGLDQVSRRLSRDSDTLYELIVIALAFAVLIWAPSYVRSILIGGFALVAVFELGIGVTVVMLALVVAAGLFLPGGVSVLLFAIVVYFGIAEIRSARKHLIRISRAATLVANQPVEHEVEVAGTAHAVRRIVDPVYGAACAMWRVTAEGTRESDALVEVRSATGSAIVDPTTVALQWSRGPKVVRGAEAVRAALALQLELSHDETLMLYVLPEGGDCYVVGLPVWETAPAGTVGLYRDSPMLPTFRSTPEHPALFADRSETQLRADHAWALASWGTWAALCAAIAVLQVGGWA